MNALERLNYFDGQRLVAADLGVEQCYQIMARRLLNQGLFTAGVVSGLEIDKADDTHLRVARGLALDPRGREIFLAQDRTDKTAVRIPNDRPTRGGFYLVVRYQETAIPASTDGCTVPAGSLPSARIREDPALEWTEVWPDHQRCAADPAGCGFDPKSESIDCAVVLATVTLTDKCKIATIDTSSRQYAYPIHVSQVHAIELEGEKDIDSTHKKTLMFQLYGGSAQKALLVVQGDQFSSFYYTELGQHAHGFSPGQISYVQSDLGDHKHNLLKTYSAGAHPNRTHHHSIRQGVVLGSGDGIGLTPWNGGAYQENAGYDSHGSPYPNYLDEAGNHNHELFGQPNNPTTPTITDYPSPLNATSHNHGLQNASVNAVGTTTPARTSGDSYGYLKDLRIWLDKQDITAEIVDTLPASWNKKLGIGSAADPLNQTGTGPIDLVGQLGKIIPEGLHTIEFTVTSGGGRVLWNLYIE